MKGWMVSLCGSSFVRHGQQRHASITNTCSQGGRTGAAAGRGTHQALGCGRTCFVGAGVQLGCGGGRGHGCACAA